MTIANGWMNAVPWMLGNVTFGLKSVFTFGWMLGQIVKFSDFDRNLTKLSWELERSNSVAFPCCDQAYGKACKASVLFAMDATETEQIIHAIVVSTVTKMPINQG